MDSIHCSPAHRSTTIESIHSAAPRSGTMESINFSPSHRARLQDNVHCMQSVHCSPTHRSGIVDAIHCSPSHRPSLPDSVHCSPTHRPAITDAIHCSPTHRAAFADAIPCSMLMDINNYSPRHRRKIRESCCSHSARVWENTSDAVHYSPSHRYGPVDILNYTPITMTDNMITVHCPQSNISNMPDITENLHEQNPEMCRSVTRLDGEVVTEVLTPRSGGSSPEPRATIVHTCKTANAAVQVDLIPQSFYEGRSSIRWC